MDLSLLAAALAALALAAPFLLAAYVQRLPVAPSCPSCRAVTREAERSCLYAPVLSLLPATYVGECGRCGWRGRLRWRWATRPAGRDGS